eukprot:6466427-Amphidinium_carterae.1
MGDLSANLDELALDEDGPSELVSRKIWALVRGGAKNKGELVKGLQLLQNVSWTSYFSEKMHASAAL